MSKTRRSYTPEFKAEAIRLVTEEGMRPIEVARDLGVHRSLISNWLRDSRAAKERSDHHEASPQEMAAELRRLRREVALLREEREILKKAAAFFAKETK